MNERDVETLLLTKDEGESRRIKTLLSRYRFQVLELDRDDQSAGQYARSADLVVLELPSTGGMEVVRSLRNGADGVLVVLGSNVDRLKRTGLLNSGADEILEKGCEPDELLARMRALMRRRRAFRTLDASEDIEYTLSSRQVNGPDGAVALATKEAQILLLLSSSPRNTFSREEILSSVWGAATDVTLRTVDLNVSRLRKKLRKVGLRATVSAVYGVGYRIQGKLIQH